MSPGGFSAEADGAEDAARRLRGFAAQMVDLRPFWPTAARMFRGWMKEQYASEGGWGGWPWPNLAASTVAARGSAWPILDDEGAMKRASLSPGRKATPQMLELTITDPKIDYHQRGTHNEDGSQKMPRRPVLPDQLPAEAQAELAAAFELWADAIVQRWGLG